MKARTVAFADLAKSDRWRAEFHVHGGTRPFADEQCLRRLGDIATLSTEAADPASLGTASFYYVGLENVEPVTGDPVGVEKVGKDAVRSRSRVFRQGDILYGRLRPYLRKALLVEERYAWGLCSTEPPCVEARRIYRLRCFLARVASVEAADGCDMQASERRGIASCFARRFAFAASTYSAAPRAAEGSDRRYVDS